MLYTGSHFREYPHGVKRVSVSVGQPRDRPPADEVVLDLAPERDWLEMPSAEYYRRFHARMATPESKASLERLCREAADRDVVLMSWETEAAQCHRVAIAVYAEAFLGYRPGEYPLTETEAANDRYAQHELFQEDEWQG